MEFAALYELYFPKVFRLCMGYVNDYEQAQDLAQETFISVWKNLPGFRNESAISTWIFRIASNNCLRSIENTNRSPLVSLPEQMTVPETKEEPIEEKLQLLYQCIAALEATERLIISLVLEDLPQAEVAAIVGLSEGNTRVKIHRIKEKLAQKFKAYGKF